MSQEEPAVGPPGTGGVPATASGGGASALPLAHRHTVATAALHRRYLNAGLFPRLGTRFLAAYHRAYLDSPHAAGFVVGEPEVAGFVVGAFQPGQHYRWVLRHRGASLAIRGMIALALRPATAWFFIRTRLPRYLRALIRYARAEPRGGSEPTSTPAVLTHIAVDPAHRGRHIGRALVDAFVAASAARGARQVLLVTSSGGEASGFYERLGWQLLEPGPGEESAGWRTYRRFIEPDDLVDPGRDQRGELATSSGSPRHGTAHRPW